MKISIKANDKQFQAAVDRMVEKQIPFATSLALNNTLRLVRDDDLKREYRRTFAFRNKPFFQQVHTIRPSNVAHWKKAGMLVAAIQENRLKAPTGAATGSKRGFKIPSNTKQPKNMGGNKSGSTSKSADTAFMNKHVTGGVRKAKGRKKTVPFSGAPVKRLASTGAVSKAMQPKQLLQQFNAGSKDAKNFIIYKKGTYRKTNQQGGLPLYIARRTGRGKNKSIQVLYHFQDSVKNKAKYNPETVVANGIRSRINNQFSRALIQAIKTARFSV
tara:strand:+ start:18 stop:833 length:816 start_codon:yes stop_codon:yes gene_type:complete